MVSPKLVQGFCLKHIFDISWCVPHEFTVRKNANIYDMFRPISLPKPSKTHHFPPAKDAKADYAAAFALFDHSSTGHITKSDRGCPLSWRLSAPKND